MPRQPDESFSVDVDIDDSRKYIAQLLGIDEQESKYRDRRKDAMMLVHRFSIHDMDTGAAVINDATGDMYEQWMFTSDATYSNPTTGKVAPAREVANALMGRTLSDDDVRQMIEDGWEQSLVGKKAVVDLEWYSTPDGSQRLKILRLKPFKKPRMQEREAIPARANTTRTSRTAVEDNDEDDDQ